MENQNIVKYNKYFNGSYNNSIINLLDGMNSGKYEEKEYLDRVRTLLNLGDLEIKKEINPNLNRYLINAVWVGGGVAFNDFLQEFKNSDYNIIDETNNTYKLSKKNKHITINSITQSNYKEKMEHMNYGVQETITVFLIGGRNDYLHNNGDFIKLVSKIVEDINTEYPSEILMLGLGHSDFNNKVISRVNYNFTSPSSCGSNLVKLIETKNKHFNEQTEIINSDYRTLEKIDNINGKVSDLILEYFRKVKSTKLLNNYNQVINDNSKGEIRDDFHIILNQNDKRYEEVCDILIKSYPNLNILENNERETFLIDKNFTNSYIMIKNGQQYNEVEIVYKNVNKILFKDIALKCIRVEKNNSIDTKKRKRNKVLKIIGAVVLLSPIAYYLYLHIGQDLSYSEVVEVLKEQIKNISLK